MGKNADLLICGRPMLSAGAVSVLRAAHWNGVSLISLISGRTATSPDRDITGWSISSPPRQITTRRLSPVARAARGRRGLSGPALRRSCDAKGPGRHARCRGLAGARDRRQHRDFHAGRRRDDQGDPRSESARAVLCGTWCGRPCCMACRRPTPRRSPWCRCCYSAPRSWRDSCRRAAPRRWIPCERSRRSNSTHGSTEARKHGISLRHVVAI